MQISKLETRILMVIAAVVVGVLAIVIVPRLIAPASVAQTQLTRIVPTTTPATTPTATPTTSPTPTQTPGTSPAVDPSPATRPETEQQILDRTVSTTVSVYSVLVCDNLKQYASLSISEIVTQVLAQYPTEGLSEQSRLVMAQRVLTESTAKSCPDQSARVAAGSTQG